MRITDTSDLWWKNAVIYSLDVETFQDSNGDGIGDLQGLAHRIDYLAELGVTCLWLMPFHPSPDADDGYDITDYYNVDPRLGTLGDMVEVLRTAHDRGMRVIGDLVINHTSDQHPWFKESRKSTDNPYRNWYVWRDTEPPDTSDKVVFPDEEDSIWEKDTTDAVPFILETTGYSAEERKALGDPMDFLRETCGLLRRRTGDGILLGEVNVPYKDQYDFFGRDRGDGLSLQFDFNGMQAVCLALARGETAPIVESLTKRAGFDYARETQWANFLRNHDELTLDKLTEKERQEVFAAFGPEPEMQVYDRGLKRRLPTMLRRRSATYPHGVQPVVRAPRHAVAVLRRGDRHGREPGREGSDGGAHPDAVDLRKHGRVLDGQADEIHRATAAGRLRPRARQRGRPARTPRLAVLLRPLPDLSLPPPPRTRVG